MHELSIALGLIDLAVEEASRQGDVKVATLYLRIGRLAGVAVDALRFSFDVVRSSPKSISRRPSTSIAPRR
jgi:hydrogenase nickel incorporation protein HypA/HybF